MALSAASGAASASLAGSEAGRGRGAAGGLEEAPAASAPPLVAPAPAAGTRGLGSLPAVGDGAGLGAVTGLGAAAAGAACGEVATWVEAAGPAGPASALASAGAARCPGGSASRVKRRVTRDAHPALRFTDTRGSSIASVVLTRTEGAAEVASSRTDTADRGSGMSPTVTSAVKHSGGASPASNRSPTPKSRGTPRTALDCARPKPQARAS